MLSYDQPQDVSPLVKSHHTQLPAFSYLAQPPPFSYPIQITIPGTAQTGVYKKEGEKKGEKREKEKDIDPWEVCGEFARRYAEEENASWKEEVDILLIFVSFITIYIWSLFRTYTPSH